MPIKNPYDLVSPLLPAAGSDVVIAGSPGDCFYIVKEVNSHIEEHICTDRLL
jgi:hypothetical protein